MRKRSFPASYRIVRLLGQVSTCDSGIRKPTRYRPHPGTIRVSDCGAVNNAGSVQVLSHVPRPKRASGNHGTPFRRHRHLTSASRGPSFGTNEPACCTCPHRASMTSLDWFVGTQQHQRLGRSVPEALEQEKQGDAI